MSQLPCGMIHVFDVEMLISEVGKLESAGLASFVVAQFQSFLIPGTKINSTLQSNLIL